MVWTIIRFLIIVVLWPAGAIISRVLYNHPDHGLLSSIVAIIATLIIWAISKLIIDFLEGKSININWKDQIKKATREFMKTTDEGGVVESVIDIHKSYSQRFKKKSENEVIPEKKSESSRHIIPLGLDYEPLNDDYNKEGNRDG